MLDRLVKACRLPVNVRFNCTVEGVDEHSTQLKPNLVVGDEANLWITIDDVYVPFKNRKIALDYVRTEKKYSGLAENLWRHGDEVIVDTFLVGALGGWDPSNE